MLFSELNRIDLNVLIQDPEYEVVPDISSDCYIHNKNTWTKYVNEHFSDPDETVVALLDEVDEDTDGWKIKDLHSDYLEDSYLYNALEDISKTLVVNDKPNSDLVKIFIGQFDADGTIDYQSIVDDDFDFHPRHPDFHPPKRGSWWTFSNGAFQWIGGWPKSIFECRFSYGPFCGVDPHHFDNNHKMLDKFASLSILQNLIFVFDEFHVLKGIVSLPCGTEDLVEMTKNFIRGFLNYAKTKYKMTFKNLDKILKEYSQMDGYIPVIKIAKKKKECKIENKPVIAIFDIIEKPQEILYASDKFNYIFPNTDNMSLFLGKSKWKSYKIDMSLDIPPAKPITHVIEPPWDPLVPEDTLEIVEEHVNNLQAAVTNIYNEVKRITIITTLSEGFICKPIEGERTTALLTIGEMFKNTKLIRKIKDDQKIDLRIVVLPENFRNKETLNFITNVRYP